MRSTATPRWPAPSAPPRRTTASASRATAARSMPPSQPPSPRPATRPPWTVESRHGRNERRRASLLPAAALATSHGFPGLAAVGRIEASRTGSDGRTTQATRYLVLSRRLSPRKLLDTVRAHWSIENHLHWTLDVVFDEDDARSRKNYAPENLAVIRRLALNILNTHPDKRSTASKMRQAKWKQTYFLSLFAHMR